MVYGTKIDSYPLPEVKALDLICGNIWLSKIAKVQYLKCYHKILLALWENSLLGHHNSENVDLLFIGHPSAV